MDILYNIFQEKTTSWRLAPSSLPANTALLWPAILPMADFILREARMKKKALKLLDAGCGEGRLILYGPYPDVEFSGVDVSHSSLEAARQRGYCQLARANLADSLPWQDESFDIVVSSHILEHLQHPGKDGLRDHAGSAPRRPVHFGRPHLRVVDPALAHLPGPAAGAQKAPGNAGGPVRSRILFHPALTESLAQKISRLKTSAVSGSSPLDATCRSKTGAGITV